MATISGSVSIIQLNDLGMAKLFEVKAANAGKFTVQFPVQPGQPNLSPTQAILHWSGSENLEAVHQALKVILEIPV